MNHDLTLSIEISETGGWYSYQLTMRQAHSSHPMTIAESGPDFPTAHDAMIRAIQNQAALFEAGYIAA